MRKEYLMAFAIEKLGRWSDPQDFVVEAERTKAYAAATNDPTPTHLDGRIAPPVFAVVPVWNALATAMAEVTPPEVILFVVHGEQDMFFHQPIIPGTTLTSTAAALGVHVKPSGTTVVCKSETRDPAGELVVEQYFTTFFRGVADGEGAGEVQPPHTLTDAEKSSSPAATITQHLDLDQTFRYAEASGDNMPMHLDEEMAKSVGLPGIIIHGLCTMAFTSWGVVSQVADGDSTRLRRLAVRFSRPVLPGQDITTSIWAKDPTPQGRTVYGFETTNPDGDLVIKDGLAEIG